MSTLFTDFILTRKSIEYDSTSIDTSLILKAVVDTNNYLIQSSKLFNSVGFDLFSALNQRNISGTIGEIFKHFFCLNIPNYTPNPHADGRPDILNLENPLSKSYYESECVNIVNDRVIPIKNKLAPFKYGGVEVKCTIGGTPTKASRIKLYNETGIESFDIGVARIKYVPSINWGSHHKHDLNLLGLYYDYYTHAENTPQILAVFFSYLDQDNWRKVTTGKSSSKTTSATSLTTEGIFKMKSNCIIYIEDELYIENFKRLKINI